MPLRYAPHQSGSQFQRTRQSDDVFYGAECVETAIVEQAFDDLLFFLDAPSVPLQLNPRERTAFSATSGTILANRKLKFRTLVPAIALSIHAVKGKAAAQIKRELGVDYKTAFVLFHKLREAVAAAREGVKLDDVVEMDGMYVGGHVRPANRAVNRVDRRVAENQTTNSIRPIRSMPRSIATVEIMWRLSGFQTNRTERKSPSSNSSRTGRLRPSSSSIAADMSQPPEESGQSFR